MGFLKIVFYDIFVATTIILGMNRGAAIRNSKIKLC